MNNKRVAVNTAMKKLNEYFGKLMEKSDLYQAYLIGFGEGLFSLYEYIANMESLECADRTFEFALKEDDDYYRYFREAVETFKEGLKSDDNIGAINTTL